MKAKILLIDDALEIIMMVQARLEAAGYTVVTAADGSEGLNKASSEKPNLILLDIRMPRIDGWTFIHNLRKLPALKDVPIIITSSEAKMHEMFMVEGVADFVTKPFDSDLLLTRIRKHLGEV